MKGDFDYMQKGKVKKDNPAIRGYREKVEQEPCSCDCHEYFSNLRHIDCQPKISMPEGTEGRECPDCYCPWNNTSPYGYCCGGVCHTKRNCPNMGVSSTDDTIKPTIQNSVNGGTCLKCGKENINIVGSNIHVCSPKQNECGCEADEQGIRHTGEDHFRDDLKKAHSRSPKQDTWEDCYVKEFCWITSKRFWLKRLEDESGVSGTGVVADGVIFPDGVAVLRWRTMGGSTAVYDSIEKLEEIHGHGGKTVIEYIPEENIMDFIRSELQSQRQEIVEKIRKDLSQWDWTNEIQIYWSEIETYLDELEKK